MQQSSSVVYASQIHPHDILCSSQGGKTNTKTGYKKNDHPGNTRFHNLVERKAQEYLCSGKKDTTEKVAVEKMSERIVHEIFSSQPPVRFLKWDFPSGRWFDIGFEKSVAEAKHTLQYLLREEIPEPKKKEQRDDRDAHLSHAVTEYNDHDILCGFSVERNHPGNVHFQELIDRNYEKYWKDCNHVLRIAIVKEIVRETMNKNPPGRFLRQDFQSKTNWNVIGLEQVVDYTSYAFVLKQDSLMRREESGEIHPHDVLCSKKGTGNIPYPTLHPGNRRCRSLVEKLSRKNSSVEERKRTAIAIMDEIACLDPPGRFLRQRIDKNSETSWCAIKPDGLSSIMQIIMKHLQDPPPKRKMKNKLSLVIMQQCPEINRHDVLTGRSNDVENHPGNIYFREVIDRNATILSSGGWCQEEIQSKVSEIMNEISSLDPPGRFFRRNDENNDTKQWVEMESRRARVKIMTLFVSKRRKDKEEKALKRMDEDVRNLLQLPQQKTKKFSLVIMQQCPEIRLNDILSGGGKDIDNHPGNVYFQEMLDRNMTILSSCGWCEKEMQSKASEVMNEISSLDPPGRFLSRHDRSYGTIHWFEIGYQRTKAKIMHLFYRNKKKQEEEAWKQHHPQRKIKKKLSSAIIQQCPNIHRHDILSGHGNDIDNHPGNVYFREMLDRNVTILSSGSWCEKEMSAKTNEIMNGISSLDPPGRFLRRHDGSNGTIQWFEMDSKRTHAKIMQWFYYRREKLVDQQEERQVHIQPKTQEKRPSAINQCLRVEDTNTQQLVVKKRRLDPQTFTSCIGSLGLSQSLATEAVSNEDDDGEGDDDGEHHDGDYHDGDTNCISFEVEEQMANISDTSSPSSSPLYPHVKPRNELRYVIEPFSFDAEESVSVSESDSSSADVTFNDQLDYDKSVDFLTAYSNAN